MSKQKDKKFSDFGTYSYSDAKLLLDNFIEGGVRFNFSENSEELKNVSPLIAAYGGTFGQGAGTAIYIHPDDIELAMEIRGRVFNLKYSAAEDDKMYDDIVKTKDEFPKCPKCSSVSIIYDSVSYRNVLMQLVVTFMPWRWKEKKWHCFDCLHTWEGK